METVEIPLDPPLQMKYDHRDALLPPVIEAHTNYLTM